MTLEEAQKVGLVLVEADGGGCIDCVVDLCKEAGKIFPEFEWNADYNDDMSDDAPFILVTVTQRGLTVPH